jgi:hypothetical protein
MPALRSIRPVVPGDALRLGAARWLPMAAAPSFALMALLAALAPPAPLDALCGGHGGSGGGMVPMYLLMSLFHLPPWLRLTRKIRPASQAGTARAG